MRAKSRVEMETRVESQCTSCITDSQTEALCVQRASQTEAPCVQRGPRKDSPIRWGHARQRATRDSLGLAHTDVQFNEIAAGKAKHEQLWHCSNKQPISGTGVQGRAHTTTRLDWDGVMSMQSSTAAAWRSLRTIVRTRRIRSKARRLSQPRGAHDATRGLAADPRRWRPSPMVAAAAHSLVPTPQRAARHTPTRGAASRSAAYTLCRPRRSPRALRCMPLDLENSPFSGLSRGTKNGPSPSWRFENFFSENFFQKFLEKARLVVLSVRH